MRPKVSIVTSSYNQGDFIGRTIDSIQAQDYPDIEHIVVDGMSTDATVDVLARYPHLKVIREPDRGQADAINKGFRIASGQIFGFVNSDDLLEPGAITAVVDAIDPAAGRHVVMGRCLFIDEHDRFLGVEHPSAFESHRRVLEIWKGHCLPQPSIFWTREVWERSGPLNTEEQLMLDYDLFCRLSRDFDFHRIDRVLSSYRLHTQSKTSSVTDADRLEQAITVSRRYWGSPFSLKYWQIQSSYIRYRLDRRSRAVRMMRSGRARRREGRRVSGAMQLLSGALLAPDVVADVAVMPVLRPFARKLIGPTEAIEASSGHAPDPGVPERNRIVPGQLGGSDCDRDPRVGRDAHGHRARGRSPSGDAGDAADHRGAHRWAFARSPGGRHGAAIPPCLAAERRLTRRSQDTTEGQRLCGSARHARHA